jgi:hypothetical protein
MAKRLILHIGAGKTGTSAIQAALARDRAILLANGVFYPEGPTDNQAIAGRVTSGNGNSIFRSIIGRDQLSPRALKKVEARFAALVAANNASVMLISQETAGIINPQILIKLRSVFARHFDQVQIIYYVRHLTDHAISSYGEKIKRGKIHTPFRAFASDYHSRFKETIENYERVYGQAAVQCVLYDNVRQDLYHDFLRRIGLAFEADLENSARVNRSLTGDESELVRRVNRMGLSRILIAKIVEEFLFSHKNPARSHLAISRASIAAIAQNNRDVIEFVNARLADGALLRAASDTIVERAGDTDESAPPELDAGMMLGLLQSGIRVTERLHGKLDPQALSALREAEARLREFAQGPDCKADGGTLLGFLENGLRVLDAARTRAASTAGGDSEMGLSGAGLLERKRQRRLERKQIRSALS